MKMTKHVLIIGFGKMGNLYSKYLTELGVKWSYYDPFTDGGIKKLYNLHNYSHIMISTPPENHCETYNKIIDLGFTGHIYIDKPVIDSKSCVSILEAKNVFAGMTERYNPAVVALKKLLDVDKLTSIKLIRYSTLPENIQVPVLFDLGIHDLDLYVYLLGCSDLPKSYDVFEKSKTCYVMAKHMDVLSIFEWSHESQRRERKIVALQKDIVYEADLIDQTVVMHAVGQVRQNLYVDKDQPLRLVLKSFLAGGECTAKLSHEFMFELMD